MNVDLLKIVQNSKCWIRKLIFLVVRALFQKQRLIWRNVLVLGSVVLERIIFIHMYDSLIGT